MCWGLLDFTYPASVTIRTVCRSFKETQSLTPKQAKKPVFNRKNPWTEPDSWGDPLLLVSWIKEGWIDTCIVGPGGAQSASRWPLDGWFLPSPHMLSFPSCNVFLLTHRGNHVHSGSPVLSPAAPAGPVPRQKPSHSQWKKMKKILLLVSELILNWHKRKRSPHVSCEEPKK